MLYKERALGLETDEVKFLLSNLWDEIKVVKVPIDLEDIAMDLQWISGLRDPIAENIRQYLYTQVVNMNTILAGVPQSILKADMLLSALNGK